MLDILRNVPLAPLTSFAIGGPADFYVEVGDGEQLAEAVRYAKEKSLACCILGGGTNVLINDRGFDGLVIKANLSRLEIVDDRIEAQSGVGLMTVVDVAADRALSGIESLAGIPGTIGGAVRGNAGAYGAAIGDVVEQVTAFDVERMEFTVYTNADCQFTYRNSLFKRSPNLIVMSARLALAPGEGAKIRQKVDTIIAQRSAKNLQNEQSVGSFFMNPTVVDNALIKAFETEQKVRCKENKIPAGWFIDQLGFRGKKIGGAMVSEKHANYIINTGAATAEDVIKLAGLIKQEVQKQMGVQLQEEVSYIGYRVPGP